MNDFFDLLGRKIKEGDIIAYARVIGQSADLRLGYVVRVWSKPRKYVNYQTKKETIVEDPRITIYGSENSGNLSATKSTLYRPSNCVILDRDNVPEWFTDLVDGIKL